MDLLQVIIPKKESFFILLPNKIKIPILRYAKIEIGFYDRVIYKFGKKEVESSPLVTYWVELKDDAKEKLGLLFKDTSIFARSVIHIKEAKIQVGEYNYIFKVDISASPDMQRSILLSDIANSVKIELKLENTNISLFDDAEEAYEEYTSRFDLLDIR